MRKVLLRRLVNARSIFLDKGALSHSYTSCVDDFDTLGISVMDLMSGNETKQHLRNNNITLANDVRKILFDNNFEVAVKKVKTLSSTSYGNSTEIRIKNVNSDFSSDYVDAFGISDKPVVLSRGIHSNLFSWQDFARELTGEGFDAWLVEVVGGPYTDDTSAEGFENDITDITGLIYRVNFSSKHSGLTPELDFLTLRIKEAGGSSSATEAQGDVAIEAGINSSIPSATKYKEQLAYVRNISNNHTLGRFDWVASSGSKMWLINYITTGESYVSAPNLTGAVFVLEITSKTSAQITDEVGKFINGT